LYVFDGLFDSFDKETISDDDIETTTMLVNFVTKLSMTAEVFFTDTWTPVMMKMTA